MGIRNILAIVVEYSAKLGLAVLLFGSFHSALAQQTDPSPVPTPAPSLQYIGQDGMSVEQLVESAGSRRADLLAARQRLVIAEGRLVQAGLRPNPVFSTEFGSPRFLGGESEYDFSAGLAQPFELGGKRGKRRAVAELELQQVRAEVAAIERNIAVEIRRDYARAISAARQLDVLERLLAADAELVRVTEARLNEGDVAPLDLNLVKVESDRLKIQRIEARNELETALLRIRTLIGADVAEPIRLAPQSDRPPRLDLGLGELTQKALSDRSDLQAARIGERLGTAKLSLARAQAAPDITPSVRFSRTKAFTDLPASAGGGRANNLDNELTFGVSIDLPVSNRNQGGIAAAVGEQVQAVRTREFLEATIRRDVAVAYGQYRAAAEKLVLYTTQILPRSETNLQTVRAAYNAGEFSVFEVVNEQRRLNENVTNYNRVLEEYYTTLTALEAAVGAALPPSAFMPGSTSVLPDTRIVPRQFTREEFLKSNNENKTERIGSLETTKRKIEEEKK
ncbi:MAG: TolC family protein [Acidobacteria bacterium]|nr:TolC family protein [Acidobacteriota bacterium]